MTSRAKQGKNEKVKIFTQGTADEFEKLEGKINAWLEANPDIRIVARHSRMTTGVNIEGETFINLTIVIFYK
ncbi:hypothetical protein KBB27_03200 [Patescibacteria group bacterium]|nr:hypothetical protein [Patescibacteria group bacterium]